MEPQETLDQEEEVDCKYRNYSFLSILASFFLIGLLSLSSFSGGASDIRLTKSITSVVVVAAGGG